MKTLFSAKAPNQTIGSRLDSFRGLGPGFDFLRIFLALSVVAIHVFTVKYGDGRHWELPFVWVFSYGVLVAFFGLSGFLISGSALRLSVRDFLINRGLRIVPALGVEVVFSAIVIGPIFTTLALSAYVSEPGFYTYFLNIVGMIHYTLPGVFEGNPTNIVNLTLWTVPHEIYCYVFMTACIIFGLLRHPPLLILSGVLVLFAGVAGKLLGIEPGTDGPIGNMWHFLLIGQASRLYVAFTFGVAIYLYRHRIPYSPRLALLSVACLVVAGLFPQTSDADFPILNLFLPAPLLYLTAYMGVTKVRMPRFLTRGDYSYGIYLYGFPIQQIVATLFPGLGLLENFLLATVLIVPFAMFSWHVIEKPILALRKRFSFVARVRLS